MDVGSAGGAALKIAEEAVKKSDTIFDIVEATAPFLGSKRKAADVYIKSIADSNLPPEEKAIVLWNAKKSFKELRNQASIAQKAQATARKGTDFSKSAKVEEVWVSRFMDAARHISDEQLQELWGNILAGEFEAPGSTPPSVVRILSEMTPHYAEAFSVICSMRVLLLLSDKSGVPLMEVDSIIVPYETGRQALHGMGVSFSALSELSSLGLIQFNSDDGYGHEIRRKHFPKVHIKVGDNIFTCVEYPDEEFPVGNVLLTRAGKCIYRLISSVAPADYFPMIWEYYQDQSELSFSTDFPVIRETKSAETDTVNNCRWQLIGTLQKQEPQ